MSQEDESLKDDDKLARALAELPRDVEPRRDLWAGIAPRASAAHKRATWVRRSMTGASMLLAAAAIVLSIRTARQPRKVSPSITKDDPVVLQTPPEPAPQPEPPEALAPEELNYRTALAVLAPAFETRKKQLPEASARAVEQSLATIDAAIQITRASLEDHPEDPDLRVELDAEYQQKIDTMNDVLDWTTGS
ncbi:MAG TPA: hypothetical protein VGI39_45975 [Polyangiaceae bacterium]